MDILKNIPIASMSSPVLVLEAGSIDDAECDFLCGSFAEHVISCALHVLDTAMLPAMKVPGYNADYSDLCTHREGCLLDSCDHAEGTTSCHTLHVQCRQWKCLRTGSTNPTPGFDEVMSALHMTLDLHVRAGGQRLSQSNEYNDMCNQIVAAALIYIVAT